MCVFQLHSQSLFLVFILPKSCVAITNQYATILKRLRPVNGKPLLWLAVGSVLRQGSRRFSEGKRGVSIQSFVVPTVVVVILSSFRRLVRSSLGTPTADPIRNHYDTPTAAWRRSKLCERSEDGASRGASGGNCHRYVEHGGRGTHSVSSNLCERKLL